MLKWHVRPRLDMPLPSTRVLSHRELLHTMRSFCRCLSPTSYKPPLALSSVFSRALDLPCDQRRTATRASQGGARSRKGRRNPRRSEAGNAEIHFDDLRQTLEAHRLKNRASVIRKVTSEGKPAYFRAGIDYACPSLVADGNGPEAQVLPGLEDLTLRLQTRGEKGSKTLADWPNMEK